MNTEQMIDQLNDIHNGLAKMDLSSGAYQYFSEKLIRVKEALAKNLPQAAVSGSSPLPELVKELGETFEQSSVLIDLGAHRAQDDGTVNAHLQRVKEARGLYKHYKASCGNDR